MKVGSDGNDSWAWVFAIGYALSWLLPAATFDGHTIHGGVLLLVLPAILSHAQAASTVVTVLCCGVALSANAIPIVVATGWSRPGTTRSQALVITWLAAVVAACVVLAFQVDPTRPAIGGCLWLVAVTGLGACLVSRRVDLRCGPWRSKQGLKRIGRISKQVFAAHDPRMRRLVLDAAELRRALTRDPIGAEARELAYDWVGTLEGMPAMVRDNLERFGIDTARTRMRIEGLWKPQKEPLDSARAADDALWTLLEAIARNKPVSAYR